MSKDQDLAATVAKLAASVETLAASVARLEKVSAPKLAAELAAERVIERDRKLTAIAKIEDVAERGKAIGALVTAEDVLYTWGELTDDELIATLEAATPQTRARMMNALPPHRCTELAISQLPAPARIVVRLARDVSRIATPPLRGLRRSEDYPGWTLAAGDRHVELASTWSKRLQIDEGLREAVDRGQLVVEDMPEAESRHLLRCEVLSREPDQRPQLSFQ